MVRSTAASEVGAGCSEELEVESEVLKVGVEAWLVEVVLQLKLEVELDSLGLLKSC